MNPLPQLTPGMLFARDFRVVRLLSAGGMGAVYVVEQVSTQRPRALKIMLPSLVQDPSARARFAQEATVSARIHSDHVVEVVAAGIDEPTGTPWLAMELLEGEDLEHALERKGPFDPRTTLELFRQLCHGLGAAHRAGLVHRDLKPANIFLTNPRREGVAFVVKVLDFGIAKLVDTSRTSAQATSAVGSPMWMAPEQADQGSLRPATDVWALGLIAYNLLTGTYYWPSANDPERATLAAIMREVYVDPLLPASQRAHERGRGALLPQGFDNWFARCVNRDATQRFPDATEALQGLLGVLSGGATAPGYAGMPQATAAMPASALPAPFPMPAAHAPQGFGATPQGYAQGVSAPPPYGMTPPHPAQGAAMAHGGAAASGPVGPPWNTSGAQRAAPARSGMPPVVLAAVALGLLLGVGALGTGVVLVVGRRRVETPTSPSVAPLLRPLANVMNGPRCVSRELSQSIPGLSGVTHMASGRYHSCAVRSDGAMLCWGWNQVHQLGVTPNDDHPSPVLLSTVSAAARAVAGDTSSCAVRSDGSLWCWGATGTGMHTSPRLVDGAVAMTHASQGSQHGCGRRNDGTVWCWGDGGSGQTGGSSARGSARMVYGLNNVIDVGVGGQHSCAVRADGTVWCWGSNEKGELGNGQRTRTAQPVPVQAAGLTNAVQVSAGDAFTCARDRAGAVWCWGDNQMGQLGLGSNLASPTPARVVGLTGASFLSAGYMHACAVRGDGTLWCWGANYGCQLGPRGMLNTHTAERVGELDRVVGVAVGSMHTCAWRADGGARCWGTSNFGQLGYGTVIDRAETAQPGT
ncbi:MAG: protein kinase [Deltaproteobacteria bacterium]|nr:protein kinase [Deltaproteobacteria bacterium]